MFPRAGEVVGRISDRNSTTVAAVIATVVGFGLLDYFVDTTMQNVQLPGQWHAACQATVVGFGTGIASWMLMLARRKHRRTIRDELRRLADLNHHLRNSLQVIAHANYFGRDLALKKTLNETVAEMTQTLNQLFPALGVDQRKMHRMPNGGWAPNSAFVDEEPRRREQA